MQCIKFCINQNNVCTMAKRYCFFVFLCCAAFYIHAQEQNAFLEQRAEEDYHYLKDSTDLSWQEAMKYISLGGNKESYLSFGGSFRPRFEHFTNNAWIDNNNLNYYTQRLAFHVDAHIGQNIRLFSEFQHGYKTDGEAFLQTDDLDIHQAFVEFKTAVSNNSNQWIFRLGRQEMKLGIGRLVDLRVGPNVRRAFDMGSIIFRNDNFNMHAFYGKEAEINLNAFDNNFTLFADGAANPKLWGVYSQFPIRKNNVVNHTIEPYYMGFQSDFSAYSDVTGEETRHSIGLRSFGSINRKFQYNTEFIYQFGDLAGNNISAFNFETDWKYIVSFENWQPIVGLKLDWSSGDSEVRDNNLNSFNPMFVNPATYSLAAVNNTC